MAHVLLAGYVTDDLTKRKLVKDLVARGHHVSEVGDENSLPISLYRRRILSTQAEVDKTDVVVVGCGSGRDEPSLVTQSAIMAAIRMDKVLIMMGPGNPTNGLPDITLEDWEEVSEAISSLYPVVRVQTGG